MTESTIVKIIASAFIAAVFGINIKIIWDWLNVIKIDKKELSTVVNDIKTLKTSLDSMKDKIERLSRVVIGNGAPENSIVFRITSIEEFMKEIRKLKESRGL